MVTPRACEALNSQLTSIFENTPYLSSEEIRDFTSFSSQTWNHQNELHNNRVIKVCHILLDELLGYDSSFDVDGDISELSTLEDIYQTIESREPYFSSTSTLLDYKLLNYLIAEIRTATLLELKGISLISNSTSTAAMDVDSDETIDTTAATVPAAVLYELNKLYTLLPLSNTPNQYTPNSWIGMADECISQLQGLKAQYAQAHPGACLTSPPRILAHLTPSSSSSFTPTQYTKLRQLEHYLFEDFITRRKMLLQRLDVTLQTFTGHHNLNLTPDETSQHTKQHLLYTQRHYLRDIPLFYTLEDALLAPITLVKEQTGKVSDQVKTGTKSIVKQILVGNVPDRGGRVHELRQKRVEADQPAGYQKGRSQFKGGNNKGGGSNKDNSGNSGNGGEQQQKNNQNNNNNNSNNNSKNSNNSGGNSNKQAGKDRSNEESSSSAAAQANTERAEDTSPSQPPKKKPHYHKPRGNKPKQ